ncbi:hypothetical protein [Aquimarina algiphila]|uniref:hypothetical protein n=1 Tax=Aquimarina algiphila TaxID=2047982 RepID=UPI0023302EA8|nr:hypothetical protein [Aquimarina algiphila]
MKQKLLIILLLSGFFIRSQEQSSIEPLKSPDVTAFMNTNYFPLNEYTGRADITIPIYTINLDGLEIPISISYDTGGVKVNTAASRVGLNWSLNTGGLITKQIIGQKDLASTSVYNDEKQMLVYLEYGYLRGLFQKIPFDKYNVPIQNLDTQPDLFYVAAPGLNTKFNHAGGSGKAFEISKTGSIIYSPFQDEKGRKEIESNKINFKITSPQGFIYDFKDREYDAIFSIPLSGNDVTDHLVNAPWDKNLTEEQLVNYFKSAPFYTSWQKYMNLDSYPVIHNTSITSPISKRSIRFFYEDDFIVDNERRIIRQFKNGNLKSQINIPHSYHKQKVIDRIEFPEGVVLFYYCNDQRLDIPSARRLKKIEIKNNQGKLIKSVVFKHDYFRTANNCNEPQCLRLQLKEINYIDKDNNVIPGYRFKYNTTPLPKRYSYNQDFTGYYNGEHNLPLTGYIPHVFYKAGEKRDSYVPFIPPAEGYSLVDGHITMTAHPQYSKAGILEEITYPTGGLMKLEYELNSFLFKGHEIKGGGLRVKSQSVFDSDNTQKRKIIYSYTYHNGTTSGDIIDLPRYVDIDIDSYKSSAGTNAVVSQESEQMRLTGGAFVGYARVKIEEEGNGYMINTYTTPSNNPDIYSEEFEIVPGIKNSPPKPENIQNALNNGYVPGYQDLDIQRGKLLSSSVYDNENNLVQKTTNHYKYTAYDEKEIRLIAGKADLRNRFDIGDGYPYTKFTTKLASESFVLTNTLTTDYLNSGEVKRSSEFMYSSELPLITEQRTKINNEKTITEKNLYPFNEEVIHNTGIDKLLRANVLTPVEKQIYENETLLTTETTTYGTNNNSILPVSKSYQKGNEIAITREKFNQYDDYGNLLEYQTDKDIPVSILWGYNYQYKIAMIFGYTYQDCMAALGVDNTSYLQNLSNTDLEIELDKLRQNLSKAQIHTYLHEPLVGIKKSTDEKGISSKYEYDGFNRLTKIRDKDEYLISENTYNYKYKPNISITDEPLQAKGVKEALDKYEYITLPVLDIYRTLFKVNAKGGRGDYKYEWKRAGSNAVLGRNATFIAEMGCGETYDVEVKITDDAGNSVIKSLSSDFSHPCNGPLKIGSLKVEELLKNRHWKFTIQPTGGSWNYKIEWKRGNLTHTGGNVSGWGPINNPFSSPLVFNIEVKVTDLDTGESQSTGTTITVPPGNDDFQIPSCFIAGTQIQMADKTTKAIEELIIGDQVMTYNTETKTLEVGEVQNIVSPVHHMMVELEFDNGIKNTNTHDHPYYIKDKGWASYRPDLTKKKYGLMVEQLQIGDIAIFYDAKTDSIKEVKLYHLEEVDKKMITYNLDKVSKNHNFFANSILVHNKSNLVTRQINN